MTHVRDVLIALVALLAATHAAHAEMDVDIELVLAVDVSMSMDPEEQRLQREGYIAALRDKTVMKAIKSGQHGRIALTYIEWAGPQAISVLVPWRTIDSEATAEAFVGELAEKPYSRFRLTSITAALEFAFQQFGTGGFRGARRVIDVSGDGANNSGGPLLPVRDRIVAAGVVINGLPILIRPTTTWSSWDVPDLDKYYSHCVIGGPGAFMVPITTREEFLSATRQKLLLEISGITAWPRIVPVQLHTGNAYDCSLLERRRW